MVNVLLVNPISPESFWSFRHICQDAQRGALNPPLGLLTVAALLPTEWNLRLVDLNVRPLSEDDWSWTDMVMLTAMIVQKESFLEVVKEAKRRSLTVVAGGPYVWSVPDEALTAGVDYLVRGEAEGLIPRLLDALAGGKRGTVIEEGDKPDMTRSPVPRFDLLPMDDYVSWAVQTSRGCPYDCEFCDIVNLYGRKQRYKTPEQVLRELETIYGTGFRGTVFISDDNFIGNKAHARAILEKVIVWMKSHGEPFTFWTQVSVNLGSDVDLIDLMTEANFSYVFVGIESPDEDVLRANRKMQNIHNPLLEAVKAMTANGLTVVGSFIIGFDGEQRGAGERICRFVEEAAIPIVALHVLQVAPNTRLWNRLKEEGRLLEEATSGESTGAALNYIPTRSKQEIFQEFQDAWGFLYEPSRFLARTYRHHLALRPTRRATALSEGRPAAHEAPRSRESLGRQLTDLKLLLGLIWSQGLRPPLAFRFWRQWFGLRKHNPSRFRRYLNTCVLGANMMELSEVIFRRAESARQQGTCEIAAASGAVRESKTATVG